MESPAAKKARESTLISAATASIAASSAPTQVEPGADTDATTIPMNQTQQFVDLTAHELPPSAQPRDD
eukprot:4105245-Amphidinium_carterae.1